MKPRIQHRRSISVRVRVSDALNAYCARENVTASSVVESLVADITGTDAQLRQRQPGRDAASISVAPETISLIDAARSQHRTERGERPSRKRFLDERITAWLDKVGAPK